MSYNGSGTFQINTSGQPVVAGTVISATAFNALTADLATGLSTAITKDGQTTTTARIIFAQGTRDNTLTASSAVATDASKNLVSVTNTGTGNNVLATSPTLVTPNLGTPTSGILTNCTGINYDGFKNRIINGAMVIDQRNAGALLANPNGAYTLDRWLVYESTDGVISVQQVTDAPAGFSYSLKATTTTADASIGATQYAYLEHRIEGYNFYDLAFGTASAQNVTLSFQIKSSLTGTFGGVLMNSANNRCYPFTYTINAANTWESKSITVAGDTTGTWLTTNGIGIRVIFGWGIGSSYSGTAGAWTGAELYSPTGAVPLVGTLNATWQITGVQLEKGSTATSFDYRPYGTELALCQRYYARFNSLGGSYRGVGAGVSESATSISCVVKYPVSMRSGPTASGVNMATYDGSSVRAITAFSTQYTGSDGLNMNFTVGGGGMTTNRPANLITDNSGTGYFDISAEL